ncbi:MAG: AraC family transcriptional regulator, partial [Sphingobacteriaceae bacterium]
AVTAKPDKLPMYVEKMNHVRDILLDNLNTELSLKELANQVGTNEFDLKRNFKKVFGNTVFGYLHQHKMEKAKQLLLTANNKVATVAELMGYKYATHFTNAFKKYFGYLPHKLKLLILFPLSDMDSMIPFI